jgi:hypothetical protein
MKRKARNDDASELRGGDHSIRTDISLLVVAVVVFMLGGYYLFFGGGGL